MWSGVFLSCSATVVSESWHMQKPHMGRHWNPDYVVGTAFAEVDSNYWFRVPAQWCEGFHMQQHLFLCERYNTFILSASPGMLIFPLWIVQRIPGVIPLRDGQNPASWALEVTSSAEEARVGVDFADVYNRSPLQA